MLTQLYVETGQWDEAESVMRRYERVSRVSPESVKLAIAIAEGKGDAETAQGYGEMLVTMYPQSEEAKAYRESIIRKANASAQIVRRVKPKAEVQAKAQKVVSPESAAVSKEPAQVQNASAVQNEPQSDLPVLEDPQTRYHEVKPGENLYRISLKYNIKMSRLQAWNKLADPGDIEVGMRLRLSPEK